MHFEQIKDSVRHPHAERIAAVRATGERFTGGRQHCHDVGSAAERRNRRTAPHDLSERRQVRYDAGPALRAVEAEAKPRHDFVENQQRTASPRTIAQPLEESRFRRNEAHIGGDRLDQDRREIAVRFVRPLVDRREVVITRDEHVAPYALGDAASGYGCRVRRRSRVEQCEIEMPVIVAGKLQDTVAAGESASDANRAHHRFGAG